MWCIPSIPIYRDAESRTNKEIEAQLRRDAILAKNTINILVIDSGNSSQAMLRQLKLIHNGSYNDTERLSYKEIIYFTAVESMWAVLEAMPFLELSLQPANDSRRARILSMPVRSKVESLPPDITDAVRGLWNDPNVREAVSLSNEFQFNDSAPYYFSAIDRISAPHYLPTDQDILRCKTQTTDIVEMVFRIGELGYKILDVSGQRSSFRKWEHYFEGVSALLFCVSMNDYNQILYDDPISRFQGALVLFNSICTSRWFHNTNIILFLNDADKFAEKLPDFPLSDYFSDYTGGDDYDAACDYILHQFTNLDTRATRRIYPHYTTAEDTQRAAELVLSAIQDVLVHNYLREGGTHGETYDGRNLLVTLEDPSNNHQS